MHLLEMKKKPMKINRNMRCIEMHDCCYYNADYDLINRNMRCIEMIRSTSSAGLKKS